MTPAPAPVPLGPALVAAVAGAVAEARGGDPLAPVTVVAPGPHAATTLRRRLALDGAPLAGVRFTTPAGLARTVVEAAGGPARPPLTPVVRAALLRATLSEGGPGGPAPAVRALAASFDQLAGLGEAERAALVASSPSAAQVARLHARYRARARAFADPADAPAEAAALVGAGRVDPGAVVAVVVPPLAPAAQALVEAVAATAGGRTVVAEVAEVAELAGPGRWGPEVSLALAPDPEEEVRVAVRAVGAALAEGPAERVAVVARSARPYGLLLHERLAAAGVPHHGRSPLALAQSAAGRALARLAAELAPAGPAPWGDHAEALRLALAGALEALGTEPWPPDQVAAAEAVHEVLGQLADLDHVAEAQARPPGAVVADVVADALARPGPALGRPGRGVFVGAPADLVGADHDLVVVVGMAEGRHPPRGGGLLDPGRRAGAERRDHLAALASAARVVLVAPRADTRAGRAVAPAPWWLEALGQAVGRPVHAADLPGLRHPALLDVASLVAGVEGAAVAADDAEQRVAALLAARRRGGQAGAAAALAATGPRGARAAAAWHDRDAGAFSAWTGSVGPLPPVEPGEVGVPRVGSATRFERYATCPYRYFLGDVLGVAAPDGPEGAEAISGLDRGSLVHEVLERFHGADLGRPPDQGFTAGDLARLAAVAAEVGGAYAAEGRTGHELLWGLEAEALVRRLEAALAADAAHRRARGVSPVAVEHRFGGADDDAPPVEVDLAGGRRVALRGAVDRVDRSPDGRRVVVLDYKTGSDRGYTDLPRPGGRPAADVTCRGRHLQLPLYAEAARQLVGPADDGTEPEVEAYFWFVDQGAAPSMRGGRVGEAERARLAEVLDVVVSGVEEGRFPANPGDEGWFGPEHCGRCPYDQVCPPSRVDRWERLRGAPGVARYVGLAEGEP